ncbi:MAG: hypothetical protein JRJ44_08615 [Deltaproteobacteria bacterium]|nr:hypothetical protein [Deltaproteobacteria bacterium]
MYFERSGKDNTEKTILAAKKRAEQLNIKEVVIASTTGESAYKALEIFNDISLTVVTYHCGFKKPFETVMKEEVKKDLIKKGACVVSATHALSGVERSISKKFSGAYPALIIADTLRLFGQGTKVAVEIAIMAADAGTLSGKDIVSIGGTGRGADAALVLKPASQSDFFDIKIREIICKPSNF